MFPPKTDNLLFSIAASFPVLLCRMAEGVHTQQCARTYVLVRLLNVIVCDGV